MSFPDESRSAPETGSPMPPEPTQGEPVLDVEAWRLDMLSAMSGTRDALAKASLDPADYGRIFKAVRLIMDPEYDDRSALAKGAEHLLMYAAGNPGAVLALLKGLGIWTSDAPPPAPEAGMEPTPWTPDRPPFWRDLSPQEVEALKNPEHLRRIVRPTSSFDHKAYLQASIKDGVVVGVSILSEEEPTRIDSSVSYALLDVATSVDFHTARMLLKQVYPVRHPDLAKRFPIED